jgi:DNA-binding Lrp family transcriptional regulator
MEKPDLNHLWHTYIKIGPINEVTPKLLQDAIRFKIYPLISRLEEEGIIKWYHFLFHPHPTDNANAYFHIRFSTREDITEPTDLKLPQFCDLTSKIEPTYDISGINKAILKNQEIEEAWRIIGEQSQWIINMIRVHKEDIEIPTQQVIQFMHYFLNMLGLVNQALLFLSPFYRF